MECTISSENTMSDTRRQSTLNNAGTIPASLFTYEHVRCVYCGVPSAPPSIECAPLNYQYLHKEEPHPWGSICLHRSRSMPIYENHNIDDITNNGDDNGSTAGCHYSPDAEGRQIRRSSCVCARHHHRRESVAIKFRPLIVDSHKCGSHDLVAPTPMSPIAEKVFKGDFAYF